MEKLIFCKIKDDPKILSGVLGEQNERQGPEILITSLYIDVILQCNDILWERHALHYPRAYLLHLWGFCYLASLQNDLCAGSNRYTSSSNLIKCQRQNGSWECQMSGIQNQADKHIFSSVPKCQASLKYKVVGDILEIVCHIFAIFLNVCLDILILVTCWLWKIVTTSHCLSQVLFNEVKEPKKTHSNGSVLHMTNIKSNFHKEIFEWIGSL